MTATPLPPPHTISIDSMFCHSQQDCQPLLSPPHCRLSGGPRSAGLVCLGLRGARHGTWAQALRTVSPAPTLEL